MVIKRFRKYLQEKFHDTVKADGKIVEIFVDPTTSEINEILKDNNTSSVRMFLYKDKCYAWAANLSVHEPISRRLNIPLSQCISLMMSKDGSNYYIEITGSTFDFKLSDSEYISDVPLSKNVIDNLIIKIKNHPYFKKFPARITEIEYTGA